VTEIDPINALQAAMEGYESHDARRDAGSRRYLRGPARVMCDIITVEHMKLMKDQAIVCNIGHSDNESRWSR